MKSLITIASILIFHTLLIAQEQIYFNNIYNPENTYASGRSILQIDDNYYGICGTETPSSWGIKLGLFKLSSSGDLLNWKIIGETNHHYFPGIIGGTLIKTNDGNLAFACNVEDANTVYGFLSKLSLELDTLWSREYYTTYELTMPVKVTQTNDGGYIMVGNVDPGEGYYYDALLLKVDNNGNEQWYQIYGTDYQEELRDVIETPDGGYLLGGLQFNPPVYHSLDAMVIKTDSLGNEEWTKFYGNPTVDDDMALVAMADDGNYLVATVYGEWEVSPTSRTGRISLLKIDNEGNSIWQKKIGPKDRNVYLKNLRHTVDGNLIVSGWAYNDTLNDFIYEGLLYKFSQQGDSIWMRDYNHYHNQYDINKFYDAYPTSDNGYIAVGKARPDMGGNNKMWIVKVDSMGCDTAGCATGVFVEEPFPFMRDGGKVLQLWPNPANNLITVSSRDFRVAGHKTISIFNLQGLKVEEIKMPKNTERLQIDVSGYPKGLYYLQYIQSGRINGTTKFIKL